jgi:hypothetical protein
MLWTSARLVQFKRHVLNSVGPKKKSCNTHVSGTMLKLSLQWVHKLEENFNTIFSIIDLDNFRNLSRCPLKFVKPIIDRLWPRRKFGPPQKTLLEEGKIRLGCLLQMIRENFLTRYTGCFIFHRRWQNEELRKIYKIYRVDLSKNLLSTGIINLKKKFYWPDIYKKLFFKKKICSNFCIRMWLMAYKINICNPFRKMFDSFWIKSILMEKLLLLMVVGF